MTYKEQLIDAIKCADTITHKEPINYLEIEIWANVTKYVIECLDGQYRIQTSNKSYSTIKEMIEGYQFARLEWKYKGQDISHAQLMELL